MRLRIALPMLAVTGFAIVGIRGQQVNPYFADLHWRNVGPPRSGYISSPAGVPGDPTTYYAGMPEGGVWKTSNGGVTWTPIFDRVGIASVGAVAVAPSNPNVIYVGTGNQSGWSFTTGQGIYKSVNAGATWTSSGLAASQYIGSVVVDPKNANTVLVAAIGGRAGGPGRGAAASASAAGAAAPADQERGVYRSSDGGRSWARVLPADGSSGASDLWMDYGDPQVVYASLSGGAGTGIHKSLDGGATWAPVVGKGLPDGTRISAFTMASGTHGRRLYALAGGGARGATTGSGPGSVRALYRSDDGGETWIAGTSKLASAGGKIYADPQRPDVMYLMGTAIYRSTDAGKSVAAFWGAPSGADPRFLWIDPTNSSRFIVGVDQGAAISVDDGATFTPYYGLVNGQFYRVATDYDVPYHVCGPQQDSGTACVPSRTDFGEIRPGDWYAGGGFENGFLIADPKDHRYMYTQGWYHVLRRFDRTTGQVVVLYQPKGDERFGGAPPLAFSPDGNTLYMSAQHVLASTDRGETWRVISGDLPVAPGDKPPDVAPGAAASVVGGAAPGGSIQSFAVSPVDAKVLWAGTSNGLVWVTKDAGKTWAHVTPPNLPGSGINTLDASHKDAGTVYAAALSRDAHPHLYRTADYGAHWQEISSGLADGAVMRVVREDPVDPNLLYAGSVTSAFVSFDKGGRWEPLQLNLPHTVVSDMTVKDDDLVISTYGRGFWILDGVAPLRQMAAARADAAPVHFFAPSPASRMRWDNTQDTPLPPEMKVGDNPPEGAVFDYYLAQPATGPITLTISDAAHATIRELSSVAPPRDTTMPNVPEYWLMPPTVLKTSAGHHRVAWDLRYPDPPTLNFSYYGNMIDYREYTLNWHALPGQTYISTVVGPMVPPGTYTATLTVNGKPYAQPFHVVPDPRVNVPAAGLEAQFRLEMRMVAGITTTHDAFNYLDALRAAIKTTPAAASLEAVVGPLQNAVIGAAHRDLGRRLNDQTVGDAAPNQSIIDGVDEPCAAIDKALETLRQQMPTIAALKLPTWTVPASGCGPGSAAPRRLLFIGNSFTFGELSPVHFWKNGSVTDLNDEGVGGVPALVKAMTVEAGLDYDVSLETHPGVGIEWHLANKLDVLTKRPYDVVVMHGYSTLDADKPGDPVKLVDTATRMADALRGVNPNVEIHLTATWSRADQTYPQGRPWFGKPIETMALDVRAGYDKAAAAAHAVSIVPVGQAWNRAIASGVADPNPYDGIDAGKMDLWASDHYHASAQGYYLEALMVFGDLTGIDPRSLGASECSAYELGFSGAPARALQQVAFDELDAAHRTMTRATPATRALRCK